MFGGFLSPLPLKYFGRKTCLLAGQIAMAICLILVAVFNQYDMGIAMVAVICLFILAF